LTLRVALGPNVSRRGARKRTAAPHPAGEPLVPFWLPAQFRQVHDQLAAFPVRRRSALSINWAERYWTCPLFYFFFISFRRYPGIVVQTPTELLASGSVA
jgi:hypothetical protein